MNEAIRDLMPEAGTLPAKAIDHLREQEPGTKIETKLLCRAIGYSDKGAVNMLAQYLLPYIRLGLLRRERLPGCPTMWALGHLLDPDAPISDEDEQRPPSTVSAAAVSSIFALANERRAAPFSVGLHTDGRLSIERFGRTICELTDRERRELLRAAGWGVQATEVKPV